MTRAAWDVQTCVILIEGNLNNDDESDLYNPFDPSQTRINEGVCHCLKSFCSEKEYRKHIHDTLQIIADGPIDADGFRKALQDAVKRDRDEFDRQISKNNRRVLRESIVGPGLSALGVALSVILDQILLAIISFFRFNGRQRRGNDSDDAQSRPQAPEIVAGAVQ